MKTALRRNRLAHFVTLAILLGGLAACGTFDALFGGGNSEQPAPAALLAENPRGARAVVRSAIKAYGGEAFWGKIEGLEIDMTWITYGARQVETPAIVQMATGPTPQIRIHNTKLDHVFVLGDLGPWGMMGGKIDENREFLLGTHYTTGLYAFLFSLPFNLNDAGVIYRDARQETFAGMIFDVLTIGFAPGGAYPWPSDIATIWINHNNGLIDRVYLVSTAEGSSFGPPPNYLWIELKDYQPVDGLPVARLWEFYRSDQQAQRGEKIFDIRINKALAFRSYMPVIFRAPMVIAPPAKPPSVTPKPDKRKNPLLKPTPAGAIDRSQPAIQRVNPEDVPAAAVEE